MTESTATVDEVNRLVSAGQAALLAGDAYAARRHFRRALELDPERVEAWIGMAGSARPYREKREYLRRALELHPDHPDARAVLEQVEARLANGEILAPGGIQVQEAAAPEPVTPAPEQTAEPEAQVQFCYLHPDRETGLLCTGCERPICGECATRAAVGQLCPECMRARRPVNYQVGARELLIVGTLTIFYSLLISFLALQILGMTGFFGFIIAFLLAPVAGDLLTRLSDWATKLKRGRAIQLTISICYALGALPWVGLLILGGRFPLALLLFTILAITTALARLR